MSYKHIVVGLSGGVDSAVAAYLLKNEGHKIDAIFMKNWEEDDSEGYCSAEEDLKDAEQVCDILNIPLRTVNFSSEYWDSVFQYFLNEHRAGRTPNPDIICNTEIKFKAFLEYATELGAECIAKHEDDNLLLLSGVDSNKDQSYFLHGLNQQQLASSIFPLGDLSKVQVREIARDLKLTIHDKKDSTGICFIGERKFREFLENYLDNKQGEIVDTEGKLLGHHQGVTFYTLGQRQGLGIGGMTHAKDQPWYVVDKDLDQNRLIVAQGNEHTRLFNSGLIMQNMHWINPDYPVPDALSAKIRYRQAPQQCKISALNDQNYQIDFDQSQRAVTPGQYAVLYDDNVCLGGGVIHQRL